MSWPLTGQALSDFNQLLSNWGQYGTFYFIGPDDIRRLFNVLVAAGLRPALEDVGNRPQYWLAKLSSQVGGTSTGTGTEIIIPEVTNNTPGNGVINRLAWVTSIQAPNLISAGAFSFSNLSNLVSVKFPVLQTLVSGLYVVCSDLLTLIEAPQLVDAGSSYAELELDCNPALTSISFPSLVNAGPISCGNVYGAASINLKTVSFPNLLPIDGTTIDFSGCSLDETSVDHVLARCVANPAYVSGIVGLDGGTNAIPSAAGLVNKGILVGRGVTVNTN